MKKAGIYVEMYVLFTCLLVPWQFITIIFRIPNYYLPSPADFLKYFIQFMQNGNVRLHITTTLYEIFIGIFWGIILGMILGYLLAKSRLLEHLSMPLLLTMQISPKISVALLLISWFGLGLTSRVALAILVVSSPIMVAGSSTLKKINFGYRDLMNILQANRWQIFTCMELPCAFHEAISGNEVAVTQVIINATIGEMMGAKAGLGYLLTNGVGMHDLNMILSPTFLLSPLGFLLYEACRIVEYRVLYWK